MPANDLTTPYTDLQTGLNDEAGVPKVFERPRSPQNWKAGGGSGEVMYLTAAQEIEKGSPDSGWIRPLMAEATLKIFYYLDPTVTPGVPIEVAIIPKVKTLKDVVRSVNEVSGQANSYRMRPILVEYGYAADGSWAAATVTVLVGAYEM